MALDYSKLREVLQFTPNKGHGAPNRTLDVRIEVRGIDKEGVGGLLWKVGSTEGVVARTSNQSASVLTCLSYLIANMERQARSEIAKEEHGDIEDDEAEDD